MLSIIPLYAITIHKSQGQTLNKIILNIGDKEFASGLTYTAISRATELENIIFQILFPNFIRFENIFKTNKLKKRLAEENRLKSLSASIIMN